MKTEGTGADENKAALTRSNVPEIPSYLIKKLNDFFFQIHLHGPEIGTL